MPESLHDGAFVLPLARDRMDAASAVRAGDVVFDGDRAGLGVETDLCRADCRFPEWRAAAERRRRRPWRDDTATDELAARHAEVIANERGVLQTIAPVNDGAVLDRELGSSHAEPDRRDADQLRDHVRRGLLHGASHE